MKLLDINVVLPAYRADHSEHEVARGYLDKLVTSGEQFTVPWIVWWSFLRLATHPRIFPVPATVDECLSFIEAFRAQPGHIQLDPGPRHAQCLRATCEAGEASGDLVPDAVLAALAVEHGGEVASFDRDFARFPGLRWVRPEA